LGVILGPSSLINGLAPTAQIDFQLRHHEHVQ